MKRLFALLIIGSLAASPASAIICQGLVGKIIMEPNGDTYVGWGSSYTRICNPGQSVSVNRGPTYGGGTTITPAGCSALISLFMTARATGKQVAVYVDQSSCIFIDNYNNPYPYYFEFLP